MRKRRLSAKAVEKQRRPGYYADGEGLYLQVTKRPSHGRRKVSNSWIFRYPLNGRAREMGLGAVSAVSLAEARRKAQAARSLEFTILTAARTGEVINARLDEFDLDKAVWTVPASRMKSGREHRVPLSPRAVKIVKDQIAAIEGWSEFVFPGAKEGKPLSNMAMLALLRRIGRGDLTVHGFRSSFRDWCAECTNYPREICEAALAHVVSDATEAAYRRGDVFEKRRRLMAEWAKYCERTAKTAKVVPLKASNGRGR